MAHLAHPSRLIGALATPLPTVDEMANRENQDKRTVRFLSKPASVVDFTSVEAALRETHTATGCFSYQF